ncbi:MAG: PKD domain-containing protein [Candidatus Limnocylindria bacterium]
MPEVYASVENVLEADETGITEPVEVAWDRAGGRLLAVDAKSRGRAVGIGTGGSRRGVATEAALRPFKATAVAAAKRVDLTAIGADPATVAVDSASGSIYAYAPETSTVWELSPSGTPISWRDATAAGLTDVQSMTVAPSADSTDAPGEMALYIADAGTPTGVGARIVELGLVAPAIDGPAIAAATSSVTLVRTTNTGAGSAWNPDSPDPSGLAYIPASASADPSRRDRLVSADGEVEETTGAGFHGVNVWFAPRDGSVQSSTMDTTASSTSPTNKEPVGAAYDAARNELYLSKDGSNGRIWVYDMATGNQVRTFTVTGAPFYNADAEGLAFDSARNILYMADAIDNDLVKVTSGGAIGTAGGAIGTGGETVTNYDLEQYGQTEPEGLDVDPATGNIWIVSNKVTTKGGPEPMIEVTPTGALVSSVSIAAANPHSAAGLAVAPPSNGDPGMNIYVSDRGVDNNTVPTENDGKIYEFSTGSGGGGSAPVAQFSSSQAPGTLSVTFTDQSTNGSTSWSWDFGDLTTTADASTAQNPTYAYPAAGSYEVRLTATNAFGSDSITKTLVVTSAPPPSGNLLTNGGFELADGSNNPTGWKVINGFTRSAAIPQEGSFTGLHASTADAGWNVYQQVSVTAGQRYDFSGRVNIPATADAFKFVLKVQWRGASNTTVVLKKYTDDTAGVWQAVSAASLVAPVGATSVRIQMVPASLNGSVYVDDFVFRASP